ncbi:MAG TPA: hypothetical protein VJ487_14715 [Alphaproteobacteria bacterium]|nr:hypothetical protein [Alphaproteobacteria bacterium]
MTTARRSDPLPFGLALLLLGAGVVAFTLLSLSADDVSYARTEWTALLSMLLATPAVLLYVLDRGTPGPWWRAFWTVGLIAYLLHFWWAVFRSFNGDLGAVVERQGWVAYTNFAVTGLWTLDVLIAWVLPGRADTLARIVLRSVTWAAVTASFLAAAALFRTGTIAQIGDALALALVIAFLVRVLGLARLLAGEPK